MFGLLKYHTIMTTKQLRIGSTDVILMDYEHGQGKLIISNDGYGYNFSYYWGSMGDSLADFIKRISTDYFVGKLGPSEKGDIDLKATMREVRQWWKKESGIAWYQELELQKELREEFNSIQSWSSDDRDFVDRMGNIKNSFYFPYSKYKTDFEDALDSLRSEPWNFIVHKEHKHNLWLSKFHKLLIKALTAS